MDFIPPDTCSMTGKVMKQEPQEKETEENEED